VIKHPLGLLFAVGVILLVKPFVALILMRVLRQPLHVALVAAIGLGQIGEFSFILIHQANLLDLLPADSGHQLVGAAIVSITLNPFLFKHLGSIERQLRKVPWLKNA
jgi:monovalent cation:H+ antiporter-2, CPA2 family